MDADSFHTHTQATLEIYSLLSDDSDDYNCIDISVRYESLKFNSHMVAAAEVNTSNWAAPHSKPA